MEHVVCSIPTKDGTATVTSNINIYDIEERTGFIGGKRVPLNELQKNLNMLVEIETDFKSYDIVRGVLESPTALSKKKATSVKTEKGHYKFNVTALDLEYLAITARDKLTPKSTQDKSSYQPECVYETGKVGKKEIIGPLSTSQKEKLLKLVI